MRVPRIGPLCLHGTLVLLLATRTAYGQDAGTDAGTSQSDPRTAQIYALLDGSLDVGVDPKSLFDVDLDDPQAIEIDRLRIRSLLDALERETEPAHPSAKRRSSTVPSVADAGSLRAELGSVDQGRWRARVELDRARLAFYALGPGRRAEVLQAQAKRRAAARPREVEAEQRARDAEAERQRALSAARTARTEAERAVSEELARLISLSAHVATVREQLRQQREEISARRDAVLGWQRRVRQAAAATSETADALYPALRKSLRAARDALDRALDDFGANVSAVPALGADRLAEIPADIAATDALRERRAELAHTIAETRNEERAIGAERAAELLEEISTLNRDRLALLTHLSADQRAAITGFTMPGWDQAHSEVRQLLLILRYHRHIVLRWIRSIRSGGSAGFPGWQIGAVVVPWLVLMFAFVWLRRRSRVWLALADKKLAAIDRSERRVSPSRARRAVRLLAGVHRQFEWLLFFGATLWLLPAATQQLLEIQLLSSVIGWSLGGALTTTRRHAWDHHDQ